MGELKKSWILAIIFFFLFIGTLIYFNYQNYKFGSREDREELLVAVMFDIIENRSISEEEVKEIEVFRSQAGVYPFFYNVQVTLNNGDRILYAWSNKEKSNLNITDYPNKNQ